MMTMEPRRGMQVQKSLLLDEQKNYEPNKGPEVLCGSTRTFLVTSFSPKKSCAPACAPAGFSKTTRLVTFECVPSQRREGTETKQECHGCFDWGTMRPMRRRDGGQINEIRLVNHPLEKETSFSLSLCAKGARRALFRVLVNTTVLESGLGYF